MLKIGITGGIGSGKSTVCGIFHTLGVPMYYADDEAKKLYDTNLELKQAIIINFGEAVYPNNLFNKTMMRQIVFNDVEKLNLLNSLVHPYVKQHADDWFRQQNSQYAIKEAALLIESGSNKNLDKIILVKSPVELKIKRIMHRDTITIDEAKMRIRKQSTDEYKEAFCDYMILNDNVHLLIPQVLQLHDEILKLVK
jgi:dephospho-CoA kinase